MGRRRAQKGAQEARAYIASLRESDCLRVAIADEVVGVGAADGVTSLRHNIKELGSNDDIMVKDPYRMRKRGSR